MEANGSNRKIPIEFTDRICNILLVFIEGTKNLLGQQDQLYIKLNRLENVVQKASHNLPKTDLAGFIEEFFEQNLQHINSKNTESRDTSEIVQELESILKGVAGELGKYNPVFDEYIQELHSAIELKKCAFVKEKIINEIKRMKISTQQLIEELEEKSETIKSLAQDVLESQNENMVDPLTKTLNRAAYNKKLDQTVKDFSANKQPAVLIVCDIDRFKTFNDTYGHKFGDMVLCSVAESIKGCIRKTDFLFRYGGEEFTVLLKNCPLNVGEKIAEKIRAAVERDYMIFKEQKIVTTISLGLTQLKEKDTEHSFFERADQALYVAKEKGRNRIQVGI